MFTEIRKNIFGKPYLFHCDTGALPLVREALELYPDESSDKCEIRINVTTAALRDSLVKSENPRGFKRCAHSFQCPSGNRTVRWQVEGERIEVDFSYRLRRPIEELLKKLRSIEFASVVESFQQVLYENVLIPTVCLMPDRAVVHAATVSIEGEAIVISGTGGVGKSSALVALRESRNVEFVSDDLVVVCREGYAYPVLAWPKIYAYNCQGTNIGKEIFKDRSWIDRIQFLVRSKILGPVKARRKVRPTAFFSSVARERRRIRKLIFLVREDREYQLVSLDKEKAVEGAIAILNTEIGPFLRCLNFERYNALMVGLQPIYTPEILSERWRDVLSTAFTRPECSKLSVPLHGNHIRYLEKIKSSILGE